MSEDMKIYLKMIFWCRLQSGEYVRKWRWDFLIEDHRNRKDSINL